jgi:hypothetical protein
VLGWVGCHSQLPGPPVVSYKQLCVITLNFNLPGTPGERDALNLLITFLTGMWAVHWQPGCASVTHAEYPPGATRIPKIFYCTGFRCVSFMRSTIVLPAQGGTYTTRCRVDTPAVFKQGEEDDT